MWEADSPGASRLPKFSLAKSQYLNHLEYKPATPGYNFRHSSHEIGRKKPYASGAGGAAAQKKYIPSYWNANILNPTLVPLVPNAKCLYFYTVYEVLFLDSFESISIP